ncbi:MAG TPA: CPXCG motif-containing cysteine-rich protein [Planctomycetota bacterium]|nr:CPXCG motif-containing cysteine-rich protein [Planctomycetota bacterium]
MEDEVDVLCPYCGEPGTVAVTPGEEDDDFVQDCAVCCRPWQVRIRRRRDGTAEVSVGAEGG